MPKMKIRKTILKRFKITKRGKILRGQQMGRHRKAHKSKRTIRASKATIALNTKQAHIIKKFIQ